MLALIAWVSFTVKAGESDCLKASYPQLLGASDGAIYIYAMETKAYSGESDPDVYLGGQSDSSLATGAASRSIVQW